MGNWREIAALKAEIDDLKLRLAEAERLQDRPEEQVGGAEAEGE